jgi:uncharacterized protein YggE
MNRTLFAFALLLALPIFILLPASPAGAQTPAWQPHDDTITVQLSAEDYVTATTGKVTLSVNAALKDSDAAQTRDEILKSAQKIAKATWRITSFTHATDQTGLERWNATLETRLPEAALTGLGNAAKSASRPGLQFTLNGTDLSPTLDEIETGRAKLRETLLAKANEELANVNKNAGGRTYRIGAIEYDSIGAPLPMPMVRGAVHPMMAMAPGNAASSDDGDAISVDQKIQMTATVMFATAVK